MLPEGLDQFPPRYIGKVLFMIVVGIMVHFWYIFGTFIMVVKLGNRTETCNMA